MLESDFQIKNYGFSKFSKPSLTFPPHFHVASMWFPITCVILYGVDVAPITCPHSHRDLLALHPPSLSTAFPGKDVVGPSRRRSSPLSSPWNLLISFSNDDATYPLSLSNLYSLMVFDQPDSISDDDRSNVSRK